MICVTPVGHAEGAGATATALACAGADPARASLLVELGAARPPRATLVGSAAARRLEERLIAHLADARAASRGQICRLALPADEGGLAMLGPAATVARDLPCIALVPPSQLHALLDRHPHAVSAVVLRADLSEARAMTALVARDLIARGLRVAVAKRPPGWLASRRAALGMPAALGATCISVRLVEGLLERDMSH
jgi:hypothetical protein